MIGEDDWSSPAVLLGSRKKEYGCKRRKQLRKKKEENDLSRGRHGNDGEEEDDGWVC